MKNKLILSYLIAIISLIATIIAMVKGEWLMLGLCGAIFCYEVIDVIDKTIDYVNYKRTEREFIQFLFANRDKLLEAQKQAEFEYVYGAKIVDKKQDK